MINLTNIPTYALEEVYLCNVIDSASRLPIVTLMQLQHVLITIKQNREENYYLKVKEINYLITPEGECDYNPKVKAILSALLQMELEAMKSQLTIEDITASHTKFDIIESNITKLLAGFIDRRSMERDPTTADEVLIHTAKDGVQYYIRDNVDEGTYKVISTPHLRNIVASLPDQDPKKSVYLQELTKRERN